MNLGTDSGSFPRAVRYPVSARLTWCTWGCAVEPNLSGSRIAVVDDDLANLRLVEQVLRPAFPELLLVAEPRRAMEELISFAPDVVVLDLHMPVIDGFDLLASIRSLSGDEFLPILVLTADATSAAKRRALALGATDFLTKPVDVIELALRVSNLARTRLLYRATVDESARLELAVEERTRDLTHTNERLSDLLASRDAFLASISHELRTPLSVVVGLAAELRDGAFDPDESAELVGMIADQSIEMANIIEDLLVAARADYGSLSLAVETVDVAAAVMSVLRPLTATERERIAVAVPPTLTVAADPVRLRQILRNLVTNALRYGGSHITVSASADPTATMVSVSDDGDGLDEAQSELVFSAYHSAHSSNPASIGLGLTVCRKLARLMGGDVSYHRRDGKSVFALHLPADARAGVPEHAGP